MQYVGNQLMFSVSIIVERVYILESFAPYQGDLLHGEPNL